MNYLNILLIALCLLALGIGFYDMYNSKVIEGRCLSDCNKHWVEEFKNKCVVPIEKSKFDLLNYSYPIP